MVYQKITRLHNIKFIFFLKKKLFFLYLRSLKRKNYLILLTREHFKSVEILEGGEEYFRFSPISRNLIKHKKISIPRASTLDTDFFHGRGRFLFPLYKNRFKRETYRVLGCKNLVRKYFKLGFNFYRRRRKYFYLVFLNKFWPDSIKKYNKFFYHRYLLTRLGKVKNIYIRREALESFLKPGFHNISRKRIFLEKKAAKFTLKNNRKNFLWYCRNKINLRTNDIDFELGYCQDEVVGVTKRMVRVHYLGENDPGLATRSDRGKVLRSIKHALSLKKNSFYVRLLKDLDFSMNNDYIIKDWIINKKLKKLKIKKLFKKGLEDLYCNNDFNK